MNQKPLYLTTAIAYVNGAPHMGHAMEFIYADAIARASRLFGREVRFQIGTDEHGVKIYETAQKAGMEVLDFVKMNREKYLELEAKLNLSYDKFIYTSDNPAHKAASQKLWNALRKAEKLEEREYEGLYCKGCEAFMLEKDLVDGKCPIHEAAPEIVKEKNWFFKLSQSTKEIRNWINEGAILPDFRKKELLNMMEDGLMDVSFSRPKTSLPWGIDVPNDDSQVMYVWCDALTNYITGLGYGTDDANMDWWNDGEVVHVIGKDILRFHAAYWPAMLEGAGLKKPDHILVHGFVTSEGKKMSKSLGNVVSPDEIIEKYSSDVLRWYLLSEMPLGQDGDFSWNRMREKYTGELANKIGNLASRIGMLVEKKLGGELGGEVYDGHVISVFDRLIYGPGDIPSGVAHALSSYHFDNMVGLNGLLESFDIKKYAELILQYFDYINQKIDNDKPWTINKEMDGENLNRIITDLANLVYIGSIVLYPLMPEISAKILKQFGIDKIPTTFNEALKTMPKTMKKGEILFPKLEE